MEPGPLEKLLTIAGIIVIFGWVMGFDFHFAYLPDWAVHVWGMIP